MHVISRSVVSVALWPRGRQPSRPLCLWNFPGKNAGVGCHFLFQGIFLTQGSNPRVLRLLHWQVDSLPLCHLGSSQVPHVVKQCSQSMIFCFLCGLLWPLQPCYTQYWVALDFEEPFFLITLTFSLKLHCLTLWQRIMEFRLWSVTDHHPLIYTF